jgi:hypothetical protein
MPMRLAAVLLSMLVIVGCDGGMTGTYRADVEPVATPTTPAPAGYSLEDVRQQLAEAPRVIVLQSGSLFETREGERLIWEGTWRREGDHLFLRAQTVLGIQVGEALQDDKRFTLRNGAIIDERVYGAYGLHLVYRKQ